MSSTKKSQQIFYKTLNKQHPATIEKTKFFETTNSFDEHSTQKSMVKCDSPKFFRSQSFGILSPKSQIKFFAYVKNKNSNSKDKCCSDSSESDQRRNARGRNSSDSCASTLAQVNEIFDESCELDVGEVRGLERLQRLRNRFRKTSFSVESNAESIKRYVKFKNKIKKKN